MSYSPFGSVQEAEEAAFVHQTDEEMIHQEAGDFLSNRNYDARCKVADLVSRGRFVVCATATALCRCTDAIIGDELFVLSDFGTREEADAEVSRHESLVDDGDDYVRYHVSPVKLRVAVQAVNEDWLPF